MAFVTTTFARFCSSTTDSGKTWTSISAGLPAAPINVVVQDRKNKNLLIVGNDLGVWVSVNAGAAWMRLKADLPTVPVHDLTIHPRENDLVLGTYGRGIFVGDISHLQELTPAMAEKPLHLFAIEPRTPYQFRALGNYHLFGDAFIEVPNEPDALVINYFLREKAEGNVQVTVADVAGQTVATLRGPAERGVNRVFWNMRRAPAGGGRGGGAGGGGRGTFGGGRLPHYGVGRLAAGDHDWPNSRAAVSRSGPCLDSSNRRAYGLPRYNQRNDRDSRRPADLFARPGVPVAAAGQAHDG